MNLSASLPKRAENFAQPVWGSSEISTTTSSPMASRLPGRQALLVEAHVDEQVVARERPALRLGDQAEHGGGHERQLVVAIEGPVVVRACARAPAVADEPVLETDLARLGRRPLAHGRPHDDELERSLARIEPTKVVPARSRARRGSRSGCSSHDIVPAVVDEREAGAVLGDVRFARPLVEGGPVELREERVALDRRGRSRSGGARRRAAGPGGRSARRRSRTHASPPPPRASASSSEPARSAPSARQSGSRVTTMFRRPGSGRNRSGSESHVFRPMTTAWPGRERPEAGEVLREVPRHASVSADDTAAGDRGDERDRHTATGARIAGWCSYPTTSKSSYA